MMQPDALESLLKACRKHGLHTTIDTSGFARRELFERMMDHTDLFLYDLKIWIRICTGSIRGLRTG